MCLFSVKNAQFRHYLLPRSSDYMSDYIESRKWTEVEPVGMLYNPNSLQ